MMVRIRDGHPARTVHDLCVYLPEIATPPGAAILARRYLITSLIREPTALPKSQRSPGRQ